PLYLVLSLDGGFAPKRNTFTGVHLPSLGVSDKNKKPTALVLLVKSLLATKQVCDFQRFRIVLLVSLHDVKNALRSPQNRSKLSA
ncbi:hypothetical protein J4731_18290, partial [Providencia rettgeri]|nr:hypothetical protein [Providencia rettgeri]